jgi:hypothetical protein
MYGKRVVAYPTYQKSDLTLYASFGVSVCALRGWGREHGF